MTGVALFVWHTHPQQGPALPQAVLLATFGTYETCVGSEATAAFLLPYSCSSV